MERSLILIRGPICAGKSSIVNALQNKLDSKIISIIDQDSIKRAIDKNNPSKWRDKIAFDTTLFLAELLMQRNRIIIADIHSAIKKQYVDYRRMAKKNNYYLFSFLLYPPLDVCLDRNKKRIIPDINYRITGREIRWYWNHLFMVKKEKVFDSSLLTIDEITERIISEITGKGDI